MGSYGFFLICVLHSAIALTCGALMMFFSKEICAFGHGHETAIKLQGSTPHDQLLIRTSDSFSGLLLFTIGFFLFMIAFVKDREFQSFFARGCVLLHVSMAVWRFYFLRKVEDLAHDWPRQVLGDIALAVSWVFFLVYSWREKNLGAIAVQKSLNLQVRFSRKCHSREVRMEANVSRNVEDNRVESRGALVVLEGLDRSGKSSQCSRLVSFLERQGISAELWRFPDRSTNVGQMISAYLANTSQLDDRTIHLLFSANRWEKRSLMETKLTTGTTLIVDRYSYSGVAFSSAKGLDLEWCKAPEIGLLAPDVVIYLDISPEKAADRGGYGGERYEKLEFQKKVAESYKVLYDASWKVVDAFQSIEDVEKELQDIVLDNPITSL
ncbi:thymidylate kinase [Senna tora]|uniref:Thymidylate kinase n=1 Tax=Senna tora TaxID=362788 RepID=A0A834X1J6_9FABA|nr:thymidylate kinase [Senna tora]